MWEALFPRERVGILSVLVERAFYSGRDGSLELKLRHDRIGLHNPSKPGSLASL